MSDPYSTTPYSPAPSPSGGGPRPPSPSTFLHRHAWLGVLVVGTALFVGVERTLVATQNPNLVPSAILLGAAVVPAVFVAFISGRGLPYSVGGSVIGGAAFFGGTAWWRGRAKRPRARPLSESDPAKAGLIADVSADGGLQAPIG